ncbi:MAG TPA: Hsp33 family molecular chaperone HslO [Longimicrobiaceae bacterium]|nr:Hsp33 family molecular chaperone HslO [Longimicrobiaceae bacterium]
MTGDYIVRATALGGRVRAFSLRATHLVEELRRRHDTYPAVTAGLGRTAMGALMLAAASLKEEDQVLTVEVRGNGPAGRIVCTANGRGEVRGLVGNPHVHAESVRPGKLNVAGVVGGEGYLSVTKDLGMREPYSGMVELQSGEIGDDLAYYLAQSEQTPSAVGTGVFVVPDGSVAAAGGFLVQLLPGLDESEVAAIEHEVAALPHPTQLIREGLSPEQVLERIFPAGCEILDHYPVRFACPCSRERFEAAIVTLGSVEIERIIEEEDKDYTEVVCHFCNETYRFSPQEMQEILRAAG